MFTIDLHPFSVRNEASLRKAQQYKLRVSNVWKITEAFSVRSCAQTKATTLSRLLLLFVTYLNSLVSAKSMPFLFFPHTC